jgi:hypothetical protein
MTHRSPEEPSPIDEGPPEGADVETTAPDGDATVAPAMQPEAPGRRSDPVLYDET